MNKHLPNRPSLDHLRAQAKDLLSVAQAAPSEHPDIHKLSDAQLAVARQHGFASWPRLVRHIEELMALQGSWRVTSLETEGQAMSPDAFGSSTITIDGDLFVFRSWGGDHEGIFTVDAEAEPKTLDIDFREGPEAGNRSQGIYRIDDNQWTICLSMARAGRPTEFRTSPGSNHALETLVRTSVAAEPSESLPEGPTAFLQGPKTDVGWESLLGEWKPVSVVSNGQALPAKFLGYGRRIATEDSVRVVFGGQTMVDAKILIVGPGQIDYQLNDRPGKTMLGIFAFDGTRAMFCMAEPGRERPDSFTSEVGSGRTLSVWELDQ
jgi:uncharacterized protein (TIGR03067 family)